MPALFVPGGSWGDKYTPIIWATSVPYERAAEEVEVVPGLNTDHESHFQCSEARHPENVFVLLRLFFLHDKSGRRTRYEQAALSVWAHRMADRGWRFRWNAKRVYPNHRRISLDWYANRIDTV